MLRYFKSHRKLTAILINGGILLLLCLSLLPIFDKSALTRLFHFGPSTQANVVTKPDGTTVTLLPEPTESETPNAEKLKAAQDLADHIDRNNLMPEMSFLQSGDLSADSTTAMMLETIAVELGSSELFSLIRTYRENQESASESQKQIANCSELNKISQEVMREISTSNPGVAAAAAASKAQSSGVATQAKKNIDRVNNENDVLAKRIAVVLQQQGYKIDVENVKALCSCPDRNDIIGLAKSFRCFQEMTKELEVMVLSQPDKNHAKRYYATYTVLLLAMDKIQMNYINKIDAVHIPYARTIIGEAQKTMHEAQSALLSKEALDNSQATSALALNIKTCQDTIKTAQHSIDQLNSQKEKLVQANKKIKFSIIAAKNTHRTLTLQTDLLAFMKSCASEMQEVESLSLPEMLVIKFDSDQELIMKSKPATEVHQ